jgi:hypothetical protein
MTQACGCCQGIQKITPVSEANAPGLPALSYRVGTHSTFLETMIARLSNLCLSVAPSSGSGPNVNIRPLLALTTRAETDPSIAFLDAWATVADVLTFYQERIANEGFLRTVTERRSLLELARLVGYRLRPGVAASVFLAFTVSDGFQGDIPRGTRAQSIPGVGQSPQFFETSADLPARDEWNTLQPRLSRPQLITLNSDSATDASTRELLYLAGTSTKLNPGDAILFVFGDGPGQQVARLVQSVNVQSSDDRTQIVLQPRHVSLGSATQDSVESAVQPFIDEAASSYPGNDLASDISQKLNHLVNEISSDSTGEAVAELLQTLISQLRDVQDILHKRRKPSRLEPWVARIISVLNSLSSGLLAKSAAPADKSTKAVPLDQSSPSSPLGALGTILHSLAKPPSVQPANSLRLARSVAQTFSPQSDVAPQLISALNPGTGAMLYQALANTNVPESQVEIYAFRARAALFPGTYPGDSTTSQTQGDTEGTLTIKTSFAAPTIANSWPGNQRKTDPPSAVPLDAAYDGVQANTWVAIDRPVLKDGSSVAGRRITFHQSSSVQTLSKSTSDTNGGFTARVTQLTLDPPWLNELSGKPELATDFDSSPFLHGTAVYAQSEQLDLADEPIDNDVEGNTIELDEVYDGLVSGRWIIVSGERTDIPNVAGVTSSELVMISGVAQGSQALGCAAVPSSDPPFSQIWYTTEANPNGDRIVVGQLSPSFLVSNYSPPAMINQQYCTQIQLAPGQYANAYVPSAAEWSGDFSAFDGLLVDPQSGIPIPGGQLGLPPPSSGLWAWRISSDAVHTILTLANSLAYTYDPNSVTIYGNVVKATHGQTVSEILGSGDSSKSMQKFTLSQSPLTFLSAATPSGDASTLVVRINNVEWPEVDDLADLGPADRGYLTDTDNAAKTSALFGNGVHGARLPSGPQNVTALYRYGIGSQGNVAAQQISQLATRPLGAKSVINPLAATGGADRDSADQARRNTPISFLALGRLVSVQDYADFSRTFAGIGKAVSARLTDGRRQLVHVTIAGAEDIPIDQNSDVYQNLLQALQLYGDPALPIEVAIRSLELLVISARVHVLPDYEWEAVEPLIRQTLLSTFGFDQRDLGQTIFQSEVISAIQSVEGVDYVDLQILDSVSENIPVQQLAALAGTLSLKDYVEADLARIDPTATDPARRILPAQIAILTPDVPDTLLLTEITG